MLGMWPQSRVPSIEVTFRCTILHSSPFNPHTRFLEHSADWTGTPHGSYKTLSRTSTTLTPRPGRAGIRTRNLLFRKVVLNQLRYLAAHLGGFHRYIIIFLRVCIRRAPNLGTCTGQLISDYIIIHMCK